MSVFFRSIIDSPGRFMLSMPRNIQRGGEDIASLIRLVEFLEIVEPAAKYLPVHWFYDFIKDAVDWLLDKITCLGLLPRHDIKDLGQFPVTDDGSALHIELFFGKNAVLYS
jgi:hypothetical protein